MGPTGLARLLALLLCAALAACTTSAESVLQPSAMTSPTAPTTTPVAGLGSDFRLGFDPVVGATAEATTPLSERLASRAVESGISLAAAGTPASLIMKGYFSAISEDGVTTVIYVWDVIDPAGVVRSQAIESPNGGFRLTLNGAENRRTLAGRFVADTLGAAIHHVAFASDDIFATLERLAARSFAVLPIGPNYYDDLEARLGLEAAFVDGLRRANILYDRDETGGEYFQLYSTLYGDGFFFEIVERRNGYNGYGAPNAQFRIAAQKRTLRDAGVPRA